MTYQVEVEGTLGWRRVLAELDDAPAAVLMARRHAGRGADLVVRVFVGDEALLEVCGWSKFQSGPLSEGATALGPTDPIPRSEATCAAARIREAQALRRKSPTPVKGPPQQVGLFS